jgi:hypothetical protein
MTTTYAIVRSGRVENTCLWDGVTPWEPPAGTTAVPCPDNVAIGYTYDGADWTPPSAPPAEVRRVIKADFLRLFTASERVAFNLQRKLVEMLQPADYTDPAKAGLVALEVFLLTYDAIDVIELTHPETIEGMGVLVALGVVTQSRADDVLAGNPAPS